MKRNWRFMWSMAVISMFVLVALGGCACFQETAVKETPAPVAEKPTEPAAVPVKATDEDAAKVAAMREKLLAEAHAFGERHIHFAFDRYDLNDDARAYLNELGEWLKKNKNFDVIIEGHCDERGTAEYNLALGERRATAAKNYLVNLGVDAKRLSTISYGEERPLDPRSCEEAWAKNRRARFNVFPTTW